MIDSKCVVGRVRGSAWRTVYAFVRRCNSEDKPFFHFHRPNPEEFVAFIIKLDKKAIGFATWNFLQFQAPKNKPYLQRFMKQDETKPCLRQIYIIPNERRKGYGTILFEKSRHLFSSCSNLIIESPNTQSAKLLEKLDLITVKDEEIIGKNGVSFVQ